tara:strand:+ start:1866 stop:3326 length:1461 start_codon:yes stop_codon:yes gene_type:complete
MKSFQNLNKKTKIIATYGPACEPVGSISKLMLSGADIIRLNASHSADKKELGNVVKRIRKAEEKNNRRMGVFLDLQGPKIRVGKFKDGKAILKDNSVVNIYTKHVEGTATQFQVDYKHFLKDVQVGDALFINDGKIKGVIESVTKTMASCRITNGGVISNNKGVNLPNTRLSTSAFTEKDKTDALTAISIGCDYVALSFVSSAYDLIEFRKFLNENKGEKLKIIAKIERQQAIDNLVEIIKHSDAVMVARGDLGVEIGVERVPRVQKQIIQLCNKFIKPVIVATQMLESMIESRTATRAEVSDIANAIYDHCDAVMLSAETAVGIDPAHVIKVMSEICEETDNHLNDMRRSKTTRDKKIFEYDSTAISFCRAADQIAEENNAAAIIAFTSSGNTPLIASKLNSLFPILAPTDTINVCNRTTLYRGVTPMMMPKKFDDIYRWTDMINLAVKEAKVQGYLKKGDTIVVTAGIPIGKSNGINSIRILTV